MRKDNAKVMASSTSKASEMKVQTTMLTLSVTARVLIELGFPYEQWEEEELGSLMNTVGALSENLYDQISDTVRRNGCVMGVSDCYAVTTLVTFKTISLFVDFENQSIMHIADTIASVIAELNQIGGKDADTLHKLCGTLIQNYLMDSDNQTDNSK